MEADRLAAQHWIQKREEDQVSALISANNARLVSLRVEGSAPLLLDVALVQNTKTYGKTWWWYYDKTAQQLQDLTTANNARIVNLEPYLVNGMTLFAAIMIHNVGRALPPTSYVFSSGRENGPLLGCRPRSDVDYSTRPFLTPQEFLKD